MPRTPELTFTTMQTDTRTSNESLKNHLNGVEEFKLLNVLLHKQHYQAAGLVKEKYF